MIRNSYILSLCFSLILFISCSEGEIINQPIDFSAAMQNCTNDSSNSFVFYKIKDDNKEFLSLNFTSTSFNINTIPSKPVTVPLNSSTNIVTYRAFNKVINGDTYFCSSIPPSDANVINEFISTNGTAVITYTLKTTTDTTEIHSRTVDLFNITLEGPDINYRVEKLSLGTDEVVIDK
ncbi:hypothetical protein HN014_20560 [Aquimarina sp. TRL1]|uniref:hypothetical protein n=1 Tax=Aquimarina sp. (strain TRL1) TaxID=2736252 RepID=UPI00158BFD58|nr:hypothetical protein [Aquimarina sp. TRL1]QKX07205.1 hypothetical protein HN014_20560 [Aquimarina sp. TRL1]